MVLLGGGGRWGGEGGSRSDHNLRPKRYHFFDAAPKTYSNELNWRITGGQLKFLVAPCNGTNCNDYYERTDPEIKVFCSVPLNITYLNIHFGLSLISREQSQNTEVRNQFLKLREVFLQV